MWNQSCGGRHHLPHLLSPHSSPSLLLRLVSICFFACHVKKGGCHGRQLRLSLTHMMEVAAIYSAPAAETDLTYLRPAPLPMPFHSSQWGWKLQVGLLRQKQRNHYKSTLSILLEGMELFPLVQKSRCRPESPQSCLSISHGREAHRGVVITKGQFVILVSLHHRSHYLGLLSIKKKLLMWARKCVLCHYASVATDFTSYWFRLNEPEAITQVKKKKKKIHNYAGVNYLELLSCAPVETPRLILMLIFCVLIALQHKSPWWSRHFHRRRILLLVAAQLCLRALTPAPRPCRNTDCRIMHPHLQDRRYFINLSAKLWFITFSYYLRHSEWSIGLSSNLKPCIYIRRKKKKREGGKRRLPAEVPGWEDISWEFMRPSRALCVSIMHCHSAISVRRTAAPSMQNALCSFSGTFGWI